MDDCRFDNWTRMLAGKVDRRATVTGVAGGVAALLSLAKAELGLAQDDGSGIERNCKVNDTSCKKDKDCCSNKCKRKKKKNKGTCKCAGEGSRCQRDNGCCSGVCRSGKCECGNQGDFCNNDSDCCSRICQNGNCKCAKRGDRCQQNRDCCNGSCGGDGFCH